MNIFWIELKVIEEIRYELKKNIYILILSIFNICIVQFVLPASSIKTTIFRMFIIWVESLCV